MSPNRVAPFRLSEYGRTAEWILLKSLPFAACPAEMQLDAFRSALSLHEKERENVDAREGLGKKEESRG